MIEIDIPAPLRSLHTPFQDEFSRAQDMIVPLLQDEWKNQALETRSYRSGAYYQNIHRSPNAVLAGDTRVREIVSDIGYSDIIESIGWGPSNPARFPAQRAIDRADPDIEKILSDAAGRVIDRIENG